MMGPLYLINLSCFNIMSGPRVLLINDFYEGGGAEGVFRSTHNLLRSYGLNAEVFFAENKYSPPTSLVEYFYNYRAKDRLKKVLLDFEPDVIHIHNYYHKLSGSIFRAIREYKRNHQVRLIFTSHDFHLISPSSNLLYYKSRPFVLGLDNVLRSQVFKKIDSRGCHYSISKKVYWLFERYVFKTNRLFDVIISPSLFLASVLRKNGISRPILCIRNPLRLKAGNGVRKTFSLPPKSSDELRFVFFGRLSKEKGVFEFLELCARVNKKVVFDIIGEGPMLDDLKSFVSVNEMSNVKFLGYIPSDKLTNRLEGYDVAVLPSVGYENAPLSIPESASSGLVFFGTSLGGTQEMCDLCNLPSFLFDTLNYDSFSSAYYNLIDFFKEQREFTIDLKPFSEMEYVSSLNRVYVGEVV